MAALVLVLAALWFLVAGAGHSYTLNIHFLNAGGLVKGGRVEVAGLPVGSISSVGLTPDGQADVVASLDASSVTPLHQGTRATVRAVGQATVTNNYVLLSPGPSNLPAIPDGGVLPSTQTSGIVPIDALLNSFGPSERQNFDQFIRGSAQIYAGSGSAYFNRMLNELDPALAQLDGFAGQLALDRPALGELVTSAAAAANAVASRHDDLAASVHHMALAFGAVAGQRQALADLLKRMPGFLDQAKGTLAHTQGAMISLRQALHDTPQAAGPLAGFMSALVRVLPKAGPAVHDLDSQLPGLNAALNGTVPLEGPTMASFKSMVPAWRGLSPILRGLRFYGTDLVLGALGGVLGLTTAEYDGLGHYAKVNLIQSPETVSSGVLSQLLSQHPLAPALLHTRTGLLRRCPGGNQPPTPDGSSPWDLGPQLCTPSQDEPLSVNFP